MMSITKFLSKFGIRIPSFKWITSHTDYDYNARPFEWDRPGIGLYENGGIRLIWRDKKGTIKKCRCATDEEVRFIVLFELISNNCIDTNLAEKRIKSVMRGNIPE